MSSDFPTVQHLAAAAWKAKHALYIALRDLKPANIDYDDVKAAYGALEAVLETRHGVICGVCGRLHEHDAPNCNDRTVQSLQGGRL